MALTVIDPVTGLPSAAAPAIGSGEHLADTSPYTPDSLTFLGILTSASSGFSLSFTATGFEPEVDAIPFTAGGSPIFVSGADGDNDAIGLVRALYPTPEPASAVPWGRAAVMLADAGSKRTRRSNTRSL
jgi:hypothetical protein